jgi:hypothetical protein
VQIAGGAAAPLPGAAAKDRPNTQLLSFPSLGKRPLTRKQLPLRPQPHAARQLPGNWPGIRPLGRLLPSHRWLFRYAPAYLTYPPCTILCLNTSIAAESSPMPDPAPTLPPPFGERMCQEQGPQQSGFPVSLHPHQGAGSSQAYSLGMSVWPTLSQDTCRHQI